MKHSIAIEYAEAFWEMAKDAPSKELKKITNAFIKLLQRKRSIHLAPSILIALSQIENRESKKVFVTARSARELGKTEKSKIENAIKKRYDFSSVDITNEIDPSLLGGVELSWGWYKIDNTIKGRFMKIRERIAI